MSGVEGLGAALAPAAVSVGSAAAATAKARRPGAAFAAVLGRVQERGAAVGPGTPQPPGAASPASASAEAVVAVARRVARGQVELDRLLARATDGAELSRGELLRLQVRAYRYGRELELTAKVVEKGTSSVRTTLETQI